MANLPKFLFLDIDGVLNSSTDLDNDFSEIALQTLQELVKQHNCQMVLTSTWRLKADSLQMITDVLAELNVISSGKNSHLHPMQLTPDLQGLGTRCDEIIAWLQQYLQKHVHAAVSFAILDDQDVLVSEGSAIQRALRSHFVQIDDEVGLTSQHLPLVADALQYVQPNVQQWCKTILSHDYLAAKSIGLAAPGTRSVAKTRSDFVK